MPSTVVVLLLLLLVLAIEEIIIFKSAAVRRPQSVQAQQPGHRQRLAEKVQRRQLQAGHEMGALRGRGRGRGAGGIWSSRQHDWRGLGPAAARAITSPTHTTAFSTLLLPLLLGPVSHDPPAAAQRAALAKHLRQAPYARLLDG